jgi:hypothetical protein
MPSAERLLRVQELFAKEEFVELGSNRGHFGRQYEDPATHTARPAKRSATDFA